MKSTLKIYLLVLFLGVFCSIKAQTIYRFEAGYTNPDRYGKGVSSTYFNGLRIGGTAELKLKKNFSLLTGVLYSVVYSNKLQGYRDTMSVRYMTYGHFLDIPLRLTYTYPLSKDLKVFGYAGPNLNIGLSQFQGRVSTLDSTMIKYTGIQTGSVDLYKKSILYRLNLQVGLGGGVQWKKYLIKGGYDWGILNMNRLDTERLYQKGWYVSLSCQF
jgi:hypothetical protein